MKASQHVAFGQPTYCMDQKNFVIRIKSNVITNC
nr:unnamed protein product [Callosobruchus analis]